MRSSDILYFYAKLFAMPINKHALIRYKTIDSCLKNRFRKWTLEDLVEACSEKLYEYEGITKGVSLRTIQLDLQTMRSEKLGYNAPIIVVDRKFYTYEDRNYSITNIPLSQQDMGTLNEVLEVLKQFKGFGHFDELSSMVTKLEDKVQSHKTKNRSYLDIEKNDLLKGLEHIDPLIKVIQQRKVIEIRYQSFKAREASNGTFSPYLLKEYRNRWFLLCMRQKGKQIVTLALDRIQRIKETELEYFEDAPFDVATYFKDSIGASKVPGQKVHKVVFRSDAATAPYIITKPLHASQQIVRQDERGCLFQIEVIWNFELEKELLAFGEQVEVVGPRMIRNQIAKRLKYAYEKYATKKEKQARQEALKVES